MVTVVYKSVSAWPIFAPTPITEHYPNAAEASFEEKEVIVKEGEKITVIPRENVHKVIFNRAEESKA
jgi:hypothetical protein